MGRSPPHRPRTRYWAAKRPEGCRERDEAHTMVAVHEWMHSQPGSPKRSLRVVQNASQLVTESLDLLGIFALALRSGSSHHSSGRHNAHPSGPCPCCPPRGQRHRSDSSRSCRASPSTGALRPASACRPSGNQCHPTPTLRRHHKPPHVKNRTQERSAKPAMNPTKSQQNPNQALGGPAAARQRRLQHGRRPQDSTRSLA